MLGESTHRYDHAGRIEPWRAKTLEGLSHPQVRLDPFAAELHRNPAELHRNPAELHRNPAALAANGGHWRGLDDLEIATSGWVRWFNEERLHVELADCTSAEVDATHYRHLRQAQAA
ncbi:unannotated protein [freshwater metagenome]|uniref:Unannotated protein n=1 Tax=freshwater metagenome TaxID=449393 RepID=A0A6J6SML2_9ZZZZ|nr:hypothetical protein [Actinomycetota bacterium]MSY71193.1 hypothetical protein [Actinomycetota bacterium]